jgi:hypothetical protein
MNKAKLSEMSDQHSQSFFGQNTGLLLNSTSKSDPYLFIRCIKRKTNGTWEKPSTGEGKVIKCALEEIVMILSVLDRKSLNWQSYHTYNDNKTAISFSWEDENAKTLWINIGEYSKMLTFAQAEVLRLLLTHILDEKILFATNSYNDNLAITKGRSSSLKDFNYLTENENKYMKKADSYKNSQLENSFERNMNSVSQQTEKMISKAISNNTLFDDVSNIDGIISGESEKALLINFNSGKEIWIPKSTIHCQYTPKKNLVQKFLIDNWVLKRNKILS